MENQKGISMSFCTVVNCMDGRVQESVNQYLRRRFEVNYVDVVTEPGPNKILSEVTPIHLVQSILNRITVSVEKHGSKSITIAGHEDCAGNPAEKEQQITHLNNARNYLQKQFSDVEILAIWVELSGEIMEV